MVTIPGKERGQWDLEMAKADTENVPLAKGTTEKKWEITRVQWPGLEANPGQQRDSSSWLCFLDGGYHSLKRVASCLLRNSLEWSYLIDQRGQSLWPQAQWGQEVRQAMRGST